MTARGETNRHRIGLRIVVLAMAVGLATPLAAQEGFYDRWGNWVPFDDVPLPPAAVGPDYPPPGTYYEYDDGSVDVAPPQVYRQGVPVYRDPQGWSPRIVVVPPPDVRPLRPLRRDELPPEFRDDPRGILIAPDPYEPPPVYDYRILPDDRSRARILEERDLPPLGGEILSTAPATGPDLRERLAPQPDRRVVGDWSGALVALEVYAPAKRSAVANTDPFKRAEAVKKVNAWLVAQASGPVTAGTIRGVDKVLGIQITRESALLPGAGTEVARPKAVDAKAFAEPLGRLRTYASEKAMGRTASLGVELAAEEIDGLDAFLGVGAGAPRVAGTR